MLSKRSTIVILSLVLSGLALGTLGAGKPPKPPPTPVDGGIVYFTFGGDLYTMNPDGSSKTLAIAGFPVNAEPSRHRHGDLNGGLRWFLVTCAVNPPVGEQPGDTYPDGRQRFELFAVNEGGQRIQLSDDPTLQPSDPNLVAGQTEVYQLWFAAPRWALDDTVVSYCGRRWDFASGTVVETGIFAIDVGDVSQFSEAVVPTRLPISLPEAQTAEYGLWFPSRGMDWSPDGTQVVFTACHSGLWVASASGDSQVRVLAHCADRANAFCDCWDYSCPRWAPDGSRIAFQASMSDGSVQTIETMAPDGSGRQVILSGRLERTPGMPNEPLWSPSGTHLVFWRHLYSSNGVGTNVRDIYRAAASGADEVLLTRDLDGWAEPEGWVASE